MNFTPDQVAAAHRANLNTLFGLTAKAFEGVEKLVELNLQAIKASFHENMDGARKALSAKDAEELLAIHAAAVQPIAEKALAYSRHVYDIAAQTQSEFAKAVEAQLAENAQKVQSLVDQFAKNAPTGESTVAIVKSAISAANSAYDTVQKATRQAVEATQSNLQAAAVTVEQEAEPASTAGRKPAAA